jgi:alpha-beta hydrolase superfamily lysophospholipase
MGNLTDFYLSAHSFGGYIMGNYAAAYHKHIKKVLLVSPIGIKERPKDYDVVAVAKERFKGN